MSYKKLTTTPPGEIKEINTDAEMTAVLTAENVGKCYKFTGTTGTYVNGDLYVVEFIPLPAGYTRLEYIESTGTQYINTNKAFPDGFRAEFDCQFTENSKIVNTLQGLLGCHNASSPHCRNTLVYIHSMSSGTNTRIALGQDETTADLYRDVPNSSVSTSIVYNVIAQNYNNMSILKFGDLVNLSSSNTWTHTSNNLFIFAQNRGSAYSFSRWRLIGNMKLYSPTNLEFNFIPAKRDSDAAIGLYDAVSNTFFENAGSDQFIAGPVVNY